jgi:hypothetical protein
MALMDANGGQLPTLQGQPGQLGQSVASLSDSNSGSQANTPAAIAALGNPNGIPSSTSTTNSSGTSGSDTSGNPPPDGQNPPSSAGSNSTNQFGPNQPGSQNPQTPPPTPGGLNSLGNLGNGQNMTGVAAGGLLVDPATLAAMALLKPTGPVDGPVLGGLLTGVACTQDARSLKFYHGGKKYIDWEFIWNPLEDAAAAMQQQMGGANGAPGVTGGTMGLPIANPFGGGPTANPNGNAGANPGGNMPPQQNPSPSQNNQPPQ